MSTSSPGNPRLPLTVVGGYLGAGKTTLVNRLLADPQGQRIAVLVNDFGEISIDEMLIAGSSGDGSVLSLANGCVCCSLAEGFAETLGRVREMADRLDRVVVEVSGVGEPAKVARWSRTPGFSPDGVLVVVDGSRIAEQLEDRRIGETVAAQVADADLLLVTRADLLEELELAAAEQVLAGISPAPVLRSPADPALLFGLEPVAGDRTAEPHHAEHVSASRTLDQPVERATLDLWFRVRPRGVVRAKGIVRLADAPDERTVVQVAGTHASVTTAGDWTGDEPGGEPGSKPGNEPGNEPRDVPGSEHGSEHGSAHGSAPGAEHGNAPGGEPGNAPGGGAGAVVAIAVPGTPRAALVKWLGMLEG